MKILKVPYTGNIKRIFKLISIVPLFFGCEDTVDVDVPESEPRLAIEASLDWEKGTQGNEQQIRLSMTTPYFDNDQSTPVVGASIQVINVDTEELFVFGHQGNGIYATDEFVPRLNNSYRLEVTYDNEIYLAEERLHSVVDIDELAQSRENGFDDDLLELNIYFTDPEDEVNFYIIWCQSNSDLFPFLFDFDDEFVNGNQIHFTYEKSDDPDNGQFPFEPSETAWVRLLGVSERYHDYMGLLISQSGTGGNPFGAVPATLRGNIVNTTDQDHYALGYFRVTQVATGLYTFE